MGRLDDKIALITASGSGMGKASALLFGSEGASVVVVDIDFEAAGRTAKEVEGLGGTGIPWQADVGNVPALRQLFDMVRDRFGRLNVLFNHAGIPGPSGLDISEEQFNHTVDVNLKSAFFATSLAVPLLRLAAPSASVIFTSSVSGLKGSPLSPVYSMTKGGVVLLARSLARQLGPEQIRVNAICPGPTDTPMMRIFADPQRKGLSGDAFEADREVRERTLPLQRLAAPDDIARAALFLASDESRYITGVALPVDGGMYA